MPSPENRTPWQAVALASGACAAFNGVFAKLTTADATATLASELSRLSGLDQHQQPLEYALRAVVFALSFAVSGAMWALYTRALARAPSAIQANVVNTAANFVAAALLGLALFGESLPPLWWAGAGLLIAGTVMIGRRSDDEKAKGD